MEKCRCCWPPSWCGIFIDPEHTLIRVEFLICWGAKQPVLEGGWIKLYSCFAFFREWSMFSTFFLGFSNSNQTKTRPCKPVLGDKFTRLPFMAFLFFSPIVLDITNARSFHEQFHLKQTDPGMELPHLYTRWCPGGTALHCGWNQLIWG